MFLRGCSRGKRFDEHPLGWEAGIDGLLLSVILFLTFAGTTDDKKTTSAMTTAADGATLSPSSEVTQLCPRSVGGACDVLAGRA